MNPSYNRAHSEIERGGCYRIHLRVIHKKGWLDIVDIFKHKNHIETELCADEAAFLTAVLDAERWCQSRGGLLI